VLKNLAIIVMMNRSLGVIGCHSFTKLMGTIIYTDFLIILQPNLGILCIILFIFARLFKGWFDRELGTGKLYKNNNQMEIKSGFRQKFKKMDDSFLMV